MKRLLFRLRVVVFSFLAGNGFGATSWGHWQHDNAHTGRTHAPVDPSSLALAWSAENYLRPLIVGDTLYARRLDGESTTVTAFSLTDGQVKSAISQKQPLLFSSKPLVGKGSLAVRKQRPE